MCATSLSHGHDEVTDVSAIPSAFYVVSRNLDLGLQACIASTVTQ